VQKTGLLLGAPAGRLLGFRPEYDGGSPDTPALAI
jgi:hypothetical protein